MIHHSQEILKTGGVDFIGKAFKELDKLKLECNHLLQECETRIDLDRSEDDMLRRKQGSTRWTHKSTDDAAQELIKKIDKMKQYLQQANNGDGFVLKSFTTSNQPWMSILVDTKLYHNIFQILNILNYRNIY